MPEPHYGISSRLLHQIALGLPFISEASFDIEQALLRPDAASIIDRKHVFISGLARSGTTLLMRRFYASRKFVSLTYRDMPFVLMPALWRKACSSSRQYSEKQERAHGDSLLVDYDSPEAFEEVFWRVFTRSEYIRSNKLVPMTAKDDVIDKFRAYVASILSCSEHKQNRCYLSKNNNNILRLPAIQKAFPNALILLSFRDPLQQAASLLRQHTRFVLEHQTDKFVCSYMRWLGHHEFGFDHRPFYFKEDPPQYHDPNDLNYWIELWLNNYRWLDSNAPKTALFLSYETFCAKPDYVWHKLAEKACIPPDIQQEDKIVLKNRPLENFCDQKLLDRAEKVYGSLLARESWISIK